MQLIASTPEFDEEGLNELRKTYLKFNMHIYRWNKELHDCYYIDIKPYVTAHTQICYLYDQLIHLISDIKREAELKSDLYVMHTVTLEKESSPHLGHGFSLVP